MHVFASYNFAIFHKYSYYYLYLMKLYNLNTDKKQDKKFCALEKYVDLSFNFLNRLDMIIEPLKEISLTS